MHRRRSGLTNHKKAYSCAMCPDTSRPTISYISIIDTIWLYPESDLGWVLTNTTIPYTRSGSSIYFNTLANLISFYDEVFNKTAISQPVGNVGYSLGVGTVTRAYGDNRLYLKLNSGQTVVVWTLMTQITRQADLPSGGNSPDGMVGWGLIYSDWDLNGVLDPYNYTPPSGGDRSFEVSSDINRYKMYKYIKTLLYIFIMDHAMFFIREYERCKQQGNFVKEFKELIKKFF